MNKRSGLETRKRILDSALKIFNEQGYDAASMRMISKGAGISVGGVYLYFTNKTDLYNTILNEWLENLQKQTVEALIKARDPLEEITAFVTITLQYAREHREMLILQRREIGCEPVSEVKQQFLLLRRRMMSDIIKRGIDQGIFRSCDPDEVARIIFNLIRGFVMSLLLDDDALFSTDSCVDLLLNGLVRRTNE